MELVIKLKAGTTLAQAEEMFEEFLTIGGYEGLIEDIKLQPREIS